VGPYMALFMHEKYPENASKFNMHEVLGTQGSECDTS
jgi:hypothetical protein